MGGCCSKDTRNGTTEDSEYKETSFFDVNDADFNDPDVNGELTAASELNEVNEQPTVDPNTDEVDHKGKRLSRGNSLAKTQHGEAIEKEVKAEVQRATVILMERDEAVLAARPQEKPSVTTDSQEDSEPEADGFAGFEEEARADELARAEEKLAQAREVALKRAEHYDSLVVANAEIKKKEIEKEETTTFGFLVEDEVSEIRLKFLEAEKVEAERRRAEAEALKPKKRWKAPPKIDLPPSKASLGIPDNLLDSDYDEDEAVPPAHTLADSGAVDVADISEGMVEMVGSTGDLVGTEDAVVPDQARGIDDGVTEGADGVAHGHISELQPVEAAQPEWLHMGCTKAEAEAALCADGGLNRQGHFLMRTLPDCKSPTEFVLSVVYRGSCTHHMLDMNPDRTRLNGVPLPETVATLESVVDYLREQRQEPLWPLELSSCAPRKRAVEERETGSDSADNEKVVCAVVDSGANVFGGEVESSDDGMPDKHDFDIADATMAGQTDVTPPWLLPALDSDRHRALLEKADGLAEDGRFLITPLLGGEDSGAYVLSVVQQGTVAHHKLNVNEDGCALNGTNLPDEISTLSHVVEYLGQERPDWPMPLSAHVPADICEL